MAEQLDVLIKLFETLETANKDMRNSVSKLTDQQVHLVSLIEHLPIGELKQALKDHSKESSDDIGTCKETVEEKTDTLIGMVGSLKTSVTKMIWVVCIAFSFLATSYLIVRAVNDSTKEHTKLKNDIIKELNIKRSDKLGLLGN